MLYCVLNSYKVALIFWFGFFNVCRTFLSPILLFASPKTLMAHLSSSHTIWDTVHVSWTNGAGRVTLQSLILGVSGLEQILSSNCPFSLYNETLLSSQCDREESQPNVTGIYFSSKPFWFTALSGFAVTQYSNWIWGKLQSSC